MLIAALNLSSFFTRRRLSPRLAWGPLGLLLCLACMACTPRHDWREIQGEGGAYRAWLPAKPSTQSQPVVLDGRELTMTMTAARVGQVTYAIGSARLPDPQQAAAVLQQLKAALLGNIDGRIVQETALQPGPAGLRMTLEARGALPGVAADKAPLQLTAQLIAHQDRIYQLVVLGPEPDIEREEVNTFLTGFRLR